jgi:predicted transcriptional regulator
MKRPVSPIKKLVLAFFCQVVYSLCKNANTISGAWFMTLQEISVHLNLLTQHQLRLLQIVYESGERWLTRAQVAKGLNKRRLTPYDINCLRLLAEKGIVQEGQQETSAPGSDFAYCYNMTDYTAELVQQWSEVRARQLRETFVPENFRPPLNLMVE